MSDEERAIFDWLKGVSTTTDMTSIHLLRFYATQRQVNHKHGIDKKGERLNIHTFPTNI